MDKCNKWVTFCRSCLAALLLLGVLVLPAQKLQATEVMPPEAATTEVAPPETATTEVAPPETATTEAPKKEETEQTTQKKPETTPVKPVLKADKITSTVNENGQGITLKVVNLVNTMPLTKVQYRIYNGSKKIYTLDVKGTSGQFSGTVKFSSLKKFSKASSYNVKAYAYDKKGTAKQLGATLKVSVKPSAGKVKGTFVSKQKKLKIILSQAIKAKDFKSVTFSVYGKDAGSKKAKKFKAKYDKKKGYWYTTISVSKDLASFKYDDYVIKASVKDSKNKSISAKKATVKPEAATTSVTMASKNEANGTFTWKTGKISSKSGVKSVEMVVWRSNSDKKTYKTKKNKDGSYQTTVNVKDHKYRFGTYNVQVLVTMGNGLKVNAKSASAAFSPKNFMVVGAKTSKFTKTIKIHNLAATGKVTFDVWSKTNGTDDKTTYTASVSGTTATAEIQMSKLKHSGTIYVQVYSNGTPQGACLSFTVSDSDLSLDGWRYEKYHGKTYKFYYENGKKVKDVSKILKMKKSQGTSGAKLYVEVNRAANVVNIFAWDKDKKSYIIPVKSFTVSVGADTKTEKGAGSLGKHTSFTPLGDYSISNFNGASVPKITKYTFHETYGLLYARWVTHIVGNVYFHPIAVGGSFANNRVDYSLNRNTFNKLGTAQSAGCIRMMVGDAKWIFDYVKKGTKVKIVKGSTKYPGPLGKTKNPKINHSSVTYDPTNPMISDSRKKKDYKKKYITGYMTKSGKRVGY